MLIGVGGRLVLRVSGVESHRCVSQANYCRMVLVPMQFYAFQDLKDGLYFFLSESNSLPGRGEKAESEAIDRHFGLTWFEKVDDLPDGVLVRRTAREGQHMDFMLQTPAELLRAAGWMPPVAVDASAREVELMLEATFLDHTLVRFEHQQETADAEDPFVFSLRNPNDAEQMMWDGKSLPEMPKMALARRLEVLHGRNRMECFNSMSKIMMIPPTFPRCQQPPKEAAAEERAKQQEERDELEAERVEGVGEQLRQAKKASRQHLERREEVGAKEAEAGALVVEYLLFGATSRRWW